MQTPGFLLTLALVHCFSITYSQDKNKDIDAVNAETTIINSDTSLKTVVLNNEEFLEKITDGGGKLTGFYKNGNLKKIVSWVGLSHGNEILEYYFKHDSLIFVHEEFHGFIYDDQNQSFRPDSTEKIFEGQYYFTDNKLIDFVTLGHNRFEDDSIDAEKVLLEEARKNKDFLTHHIK